LLVCRLFHDDPATSARFTRFVNEVEAMHPHVKCRIVHVIRRGQV